MSYALWRIFDPRLFLCSSAIRVHGHRVAAEGNGRVSSAACVCIQQRIKHFPWSLDFTATDDRSCKSNSRGTYLDTAALTFNTSSADNTSALHPSSEFLAAAAKVGTINAAADAGDRSLVRVLPEGPVGPAAGHGRRRSVATDPEGVVRAHATATSLRVPVKGQRRCKL
jgi:hypothetical protein